MIVTGLVGALVKSSYKWGYYGFGCAALFVSIRLRVSQMPELILSKYIWWVLAGPARTSSGALGPEYKKSFTTSAVILSVVWLGYPVRLPPSRQILIANYCGRSPGVFVTAGITSPRIPK